MHVSNIQNSTVCQVSLRDGVFSVHLLPFMCTMGRDTINHWLKKMPVRSARPFPASSLPCLLCENESWKSAWGEFGPVQYCLAWLKALFSLAQNSVDWWCPLAWFRVLFGLTLGVLFWNIQQGWGFKAISRYGSCVPRVYLWEEQHNLPP